MTWDVLDAELEDTIEAERAKRARYREARQRRMRLRYCSRCGAQISRGASRCKQHEIRIIIAPIRR